MSSTSTATPSHAILYSKVLNDNGDKDDSGKKSWLGLKTKNNRLVKCFAYATDTDPDWTKAVSLEDWATKDAQSIDLA